MTTIFIDKNNNKIYADTQVTCGDNVYECDKVSTHVLHGHTIQIAMVGDLMCARKLVDAIVAKMKKEEMCVIFPDLITFKNLFNDAEKEYIKHNNFEVIVLTVIDKESKITVFDNGLNLKPFVVLGNYSSGLGGNYGRLIYEMMTREQGLDWYHNMSTESQKKQWDALFIERLNCIHHVDRSTNNKFKVYEAKEKLKNINF